MSRIDADTIIAGLGGNPSTGRCHCPAHDDKRPSLQVTQSGDKALVICRAGCAQGDIINALRARGLWGNVTPIGEKQQKRKKDSERFRDEQREKYQSFMRGVALLRDATAEGRKRPTAYLKRRGLNRVPPAAMLLSAEAAGRLSGKRYPAMVLTITDGNALLGTQLTWLSRDATEKLHLKDNDPRRTFGSAKGGYAICGPADPAKPLIIGEGVENTLAAMQLSGCECGIAGINAGNMPNVQPPKCKEVIIAADNDEPGQDNKTPGQRAARALAERLAFEGVKVRIVLPPQQGTDWNNVLLDDRAPKATWKHALDAARVVAPNAAGKIEPLEESEFMELVFPPRQLLLGPWLPNPGLAMIHAKRGEGKTWLALAVGKAVANGTDLLEWPCPNSGRVLYVDGEMPGTSLQERLQKFPPSPRGMFHMLCSEQYNRVDRPVPDLGTPEGRAELDRMIERCDPDLIILDSISTLVRTGEENSNDAWKPIQSWSMRHRSAGRTILFLHHDGKGGTQRGGSGKEDTPESGFQLRRKPEADGPNDTVFELTYDKGRDFFGKDYLPFQVRLSVDGGRVNWARETIRNERDDKIRELSEAGMNATRIAKELNMTKQHIGRLLRKIKQDDKDEPERVVKFRPITRPAQRGVT
jgi:putative DNA primase/helicase